MTRIVGISGSLRRASFNTALLRAAARLAPEGVEISVNTLHGIPPYDGDVEAESGLPQAVAALKERIREADALLLATPEYNASIPGVFKNGIDWLSRPPQDIPSLFGGKPVAVIGASPGNYGTQLAQTAWLPVFRALGLGPWFGRALYVARARTVFDETGELVDEATSDRLRRLVAEYAEHVRRIAGGGD